MPRFDLLQSDSGRQRVDYIARPSGDGADTSLLVLFHGIGDSARNFADFGARLNLPQTCIVAVQAPLPLPLGLPGGAWYPAISEDGDMGWLDADSGGGGGSAAGLERTREVTLQWIRDRVVGHCGWPCRSLFFLGVGQGAVVAVDLAMALGGAEEAVGGVVALGPAFFPDSPDALPPRPKWAKARGGGGAGVAGLGGLVGMAENKSGSGEGGGGEGGGGGGLGGEADGRRRTPFLVAHFCGSDGQAAGGGGGGGGGGEEARTRGVADGVRALLYGGQKGGQKGRGRGGNGGDGDGGGRGDGSTKMGDADVSFHVFSGRGDGAVVTCEADARTLHTFFGRHLALRNLALERDPDIIEVRT
jgi:predicted esterase